MTNCLSKFAKIVPGSKAEFDIFLTNEAGQPINLAPYVSGKLIFCNTIGTRTEVVLSVPGASPGSGKIGVVIPVLQTSVADDFWKNADLELVDSGAETLIIPLNDKFEIVKRNCPPIVP